MPSSREFRPETRTMAYICVGRVDVTCKRFACEDREQSHVPTFYTSIQQEECLYQTYQCVLRPTQKESSCRIFIWRAFYFEEIRWLVTVIEDCVEPSRLSIWKLHLLEMTGESSLHILVGKVRGCIGAVTESRTSPQGTCPVNRTGKIGQPEPVT